MATVVDRQVEICFYISWHDGKWRYLAIFSLSVKLYNKQSVNWNYSEKNAIYKALSSIPSSSSSYQFLLCLFILCSIFLFYSSYNKEHPINKKWRKKKRKQERKRCKLKILSFSSKTFFLHFPCYFFHFFT